MRHYITGALLAIGLVLSAASSAPGEEDAGEPVARVFVEMHNAYAESLFQIRWRLEGVEDAGVPTSGDSGQLRVGYDDSAGYTIEPLPIGGRLVISVDATSLGETETWNDVAFITTEAGCAGIRLIYDYDLALAMFSMRRQIGEWEPCEDVMW